MKSTVVPIVVLSAPLVSAQFLDPKGSTSEACGDVCRASDKYVQSCYYDEDMTLEDHLGCMCDGGIPSMAECVSCGDEANEDAEDEGFWENASSNVDSYSTAMCTPGASQFFIEVLASMMSETATPSLTTPSVTPATPPASTAETPTSTPSAEGDNDDENDDSGDDDNEEGDDDENETTGGAPVYTQVPFVFAAAGVALVAAL